MGHEHWFRGQHDGQDRPFDWLTTARRHGIPDKLARVLYEQAMRQAHGATQDRVQELYLALLASACRDAVRPSPGKVTRTMRLQANQAGKRRRPYISRLTGQPISPGKRTLTSYLKSALHEGNAPNKEKERLETNAVSHQAVSAAISNDLQDMEPGRIAYRQLQANLAAAFGHFEELEALEAHGINPGPMTVMEASPTDEDGEDFVGAAVNGWRLPSEEGPLPLMLLTGWEVETWETAGPIQAAGLQEVPEVPVSLPSHGGGTEIPEEVRAKMEAAFGVDFSRVRIHEGPHVEAIGALAYTQGTDIHFAPGQYRPTSPRGQELLGHELAHVMQQSQGRVQATTQASGVNINDDTSLEKEADEIGAKAACGEPVSSPVMSQPPSDASGASHAFQNPVLESLSPQKTHGADASKAPVPEPLTGSFRYPQVDEHGREGHPGKETENALFPTTPLLLHDDASATFQKAAQGAGDEVPFRAEMEIAFGTDFSGVRAYLGRPSEMAALDARAAAHGEVVVFASDIPDKDVVAHELAHVVQHRQAGATQPPWGVSDPDAAAEVEASEAAQRVVAGERVRISAAPAGAIHRDPINRGAGTQALPVTFESFVTSGSALNGNALGYQALLTFHLYGVELRFALGQAEQRFRNLRPRQYSGPEVKWIRRGAPLNGRPFIALHRSPGAGWDDPLDASVTRQPGRLAYYDSPGPEVGALVVDPAGRPSRIHTSQANLPMWQLYLKV